MRIEIQLNIVEDKKNVEEYLVEDYETFYVIISVSLLLFLLALSSYQMIHFNCFDRFKQISRWDVRCRFASDSDS